MKLLFQKITKIIPQNISLVLSVNFELNIRLPKNVEIRAGEGSFALEIQAGGGSSDSGNPGGRRGG